MPEENPHEDEYSSDKSDDQGRRHTVHDTTDKIMFAAHDDEDGDEDLLQANLPQGELHNANLPEYIFSRLRKNECGPPYWWTTKEPTVNARVPARNVIRGGLPGLKDPARALRNSPKRTCCLTTTW